MANLIVVGLVIIATVGTWFLFPLVVPEPQIDQLCTDIPFLGRSCIPDPSSAVSYPQRLLNWYIGRVVAVVLVAIIGGFLVFAGSQKR